MAKISVLVSGGGTNLQAIIDKVQDGSLKNAEIVQVIASREGVFALERAANAGIKGKVVKDTDTLLEELKAEGIDPNGLDPDSMEAWQELNYQKQLSEHWSTIGIYRK